MNKKLQVLLESISREFEGVAAKGARHYVQVDIGERATKMGYPDLEKKYKLASAIVPLKNPLSGMKVRIDGRTFVRYAEFESGIAVPGYVAEDAGLPYKTYVPNDSMVLNFH